MASAINVDSSHRLDNGEIVFVAPSLWGGGAERVAIALSEYFVSRGFSFSFLLTKMKGSHYDLPEGVVLQDENASESISPLCQIALIRRTMKRHSNAVFVSFLPHQNMYTILASAFLRNRVIVSVRNEPTYDFAAGSLFHRVRDILYKMANHVVFQTAYQRDCFSEIDSKKCSIIPNPLSSCLPSPYAGVRRKVIVTSGRLENQKNHAMTIHAFAKFLSSHPDYSLEILGEGSERESLARLVEELGIQSRVMFHGFRSDALELVRTASIFVMSSDYEGLSNSMIEALAMGVPTICTRCLGGGAEAVIIDGKNGLLVNRGDVDALADRMGFLAGNPQVATRISENAIKLKKELCLDAIGRQWEMLL
ncbi:MAG: glycosyltransferase [Eggerthellaceae bacterium]